MTLAIVVATAASAAAMTQSEVESRLACQCGCGLTVHTCDHLQCSFGVPVKDDIAAPRQDKPKASCEFEI